MNRTESLARLAAWAAHYSPCARPLPTDVVTVEQDAALRHGLAAARAVRAQGYPLFDFNAPATPAIEARLAVRAALAAVGLKTL